MTGARKAGYHGAGERDKQAGDDKPMELRQIRYFVMVAEELNFSRAAERLHMSQPPLSLQIKALEEEMGVELLQRTRREVHLTDAGRVFLAECRSIMDQLRAAVSTTVRTAEGELGTLKLGMVTSGIFHVLPEILRRMADRFPTIEITVTDMSSRDQADAIMQGKLDIGIVHAIPAQAGLTKSPIYAEPFSIVLPDQHPLASRPDLRLADLEGQPFVAFSRERAPALFDAIVASCQEAGFSPLITHTARNPLTVFQMVRLGLGISLVPRSYANAGVDGVRFRSFEGSSNELRLYAIWREHNVSELVRRIVVAVMSETVSPSSEQRIADAR